MTMRGWRALAACMLGATLPLPGGIALAADRALIIGINEYPNLGPKDQLNGAVNDAKLMEQLAMHVWGFAPDQVQLLLNRDATAAAIRDRLLNWLPGATKAGDRVLIYFSGHGYFVGDKNGDEADGRDEVLVASDAETTGTELKNLIVDDEIEAALAKLPNRKIMVIADSCHSGTIQRALKLGGPGGDSVERYPSWVRSTRGTGDKDLSAQAPVSAEEFGKLRNDNGLLEGAGTPWVWTAASPTQAAQEDISTDPERRNGVFTHALVEGLNGRADADNDGKITVAELLLFTRGQASRYCAQYSCRTGMDPTFEPGGAALAADVKRWGKPGEGAGAPAGAINPVTAIPPSTSNFAVNVAIQPGNSAKVGDAIKLRIESSRPGYLIVLDLRDDGKVYQLFPSQCAHAERQIRAGMTLTMPDPSYGCVFTADEAGAGKIVAIVTEDKVPLDALLESTGSKGIEVVAEPSDYLGKIAAALLDVWTGDDQNRPVKWGLASAAYTISN